MWNVQRKFRLLWPLATLLLLTSCFACTKPKPNFVFLSPAHLVGQVKNIETLKASPDDWIVTPAFVLEYGRLQRAEERLKLEVKRLQEKLLGR